MPGSPGSCFRASRISRAVTLPQQHRGVNDPLVPGVANGPYPTRSNLPTGVTAQSNTNGNSATPGVADVVVLNPNGLDGLVATSAGFFGTPSDQLSHNFPQHSLDLLFSVPVVEPLVAVELAPLFFDSITFNQNATGAIFVEVYDPSNIFLGDTIVFNVDYGANTALEFIGIEATGTDDIGRINLSDGNGTFHQAGADNIGVYTAQPTVSVIVNGDFATGDLTGWTVSAVDQLGDPVAPLITVVPLNPTTNAADFPTGDFATGPFYPWHGASRIKRE